MDAQIEVIVHTLIIKNNAMIMIFKNLIAPKQEQKNTHLSQNQ